MASIEYYSDLDLGLNQLKNVIVDTVSAIPDNTDAAANPGRIVYVSNASKKALFVSNGTTYIELAQGGDVSGITTRVEHLETEVGIDSAGASTNSGLKKAVSDIETEIGSATYTGDSITAAIATAQSNIGTLTTTVGDNTAGLVKKVADLETSVGKTTDSASASGSLYARVAQNVSDIALKAPLASPALTGTPTAPTAAVNNSTTQIATTAFVVAEINNKISAANALRYKGTVGTAAGSTTATLPVSGVAIGDTYIVSTAGTYAGVVCEIGDMIIAKTGDPSITWTVVQTNIDGAVTGPSSAVDAQVAVFNGATGKIIKDSGFTIGKSVPSDAVFTDTTYSGTANEITLTGTAFGLASTAVSAGSYGPSDNATPAYGATFDVPNFTVDAKGRVTAASTKTVTIPASDNTDVAVAQTADTGSTALPITLATVSTPGTAAGVKYATGVTVTPSTSTVTATTFSGALSGNASTATKLAATKNFSISGGATAAAVAFDGSNDVALNVTSVDATKLSGVVPDASNKYIGGMETISATAGTASNVTLTGLSGYPITLTLYDANHKVVMADITGTSGGASVTVSKAGTYHLGWFGLASHS